MFHSPKRCWHSTDNCRIVLTRLEKPNRTGRSATVKETKTCERGARWRLTSARMRTSTNSTHSTPTVRSTLKTKPPHDDTHPMVERTATSAGENFVQVQDCSSLNLSTLHIVVSNPERVRSFHHRDTPAAAGKHRCCPTVVTDNPDVLWNNRKPDNF